MTEIVKTDPRNAGRGDQASECLPDRTRTNRVANLVGEHPITDWRGDNRPQHVLHGPDGSPTRWPRPLRRGKICVVTAAAETLLEQALTLPVEDRALLASGLLASLDSESLDEAEVERLGSAETERRATLLASGEAELVTWEHLVSRIDERRE